MSILTTCGHKAEWVCSSCGSCATCDRCDTDPPSMVHINTKEAAIAIARWAKRKRADFTREAARRNGQAPPADGGPDPSEGTDGPY